MDTKLCIEQLVERRHHQEGAAMQRKEAEAAMVMQMVETTTMPVREPEGSQEISMK